MQKSILFISEVFGSGHTKVAEALEQSISLIEPSVQTSIIEPGMILHPVTTSIFLHSYKKIITRYPSLWRMIYHSKEDQPPSRWFQFLIYQLFHRNLDQYVEKFNPNLVICTHPFSSSSISRMKQAGSPIQLCTVITDFHAHRAYVQQEVDLYMVSDEDVSQQLIDMGISQDKIAITGIPTRYDFWHKSEQIEAQKKLQLNRRPTVLVMGGGFGLGGIKDIAFSLLKWKEKIQILICTGSNEPLRLSLTHNKNFHHPNVKITGFVDDIDVMFDSANLIITKPGGVTCFEALTKGIPMLLYQPVPGHEEQNLNHLVNLELAAKLNHIQELDHWIQTLLEDNDVFTNWVAKIQKYQRNINPLAGAKSVVRLLNQL